MKDLVNYIKNECWCSFKNNNRKLFDRTLWIKGAVIYKNKKINNNVTEDVTVYYPNNEKQLRGFNGMQKPLDDITLSILTQEDLVKFIEQYYKINSNNIEISNNINTSIKSDDFIGFKRLFKKLTKNSYLIYSYEYLLSSLGQALYEKLDNEVLKIFNNWKNNPENYNHNFFTISLEYITKKYSLQEVGDVRLYAHVNEILSLLDNKLQAKTLIKRIKQRKNGFILLNLNDKKYHNKIIVKEKIVKEITKKLESEKNKDIHDFKVLNEVSGKSPFVSKIKLRGECVVLKNNYSKVEDFFNKILVCPVTTANDVFKYLDSKALIVDNGGILSHAAIFSREVGKPCLMGCNIATQVFNTGDILEIDFEREVVYKIIDTTS